MIDHQKATDDLNRIVKCIQTGDLEGLQQQLREAKIGYDDYLKDGWTLMMHAVFNVQCHIISYLLSAGADVNREAGKVFSMDTFSFFFHNRIVQHFCNRQIL